MICLNLFNRIGLTFLPQILFAQFHKIHFHENPALNFSICRARLIFVNLPKSLWMKRNTKASWNFFVRKRIKFSWATKIKSMLRIKPTFSSQQKFKFHKLNVKKVVKNTKKPICSDKTDFFPFYWFMEFPFLSSQKTKLNEMISSFFVILLQFLLFHKKILNSCWEWAL